MANCFMNTLRLDDGENKDVLNCPNCNSRIFPDCRKTSTNRTYLTTCLECNKSFKFRKESIRRSAIKLSVNGTTHIVDNNTAVRLSLNEYLRDVLQLKGTKVMCKEGGCGCCVVTISYRKDDKTKTVPINSCLCPLFSCDGWQITTSEGLGDRKKGYHPIQSKLAECNGSQCGYCSTGMVMNMYGFLADNKNPTKEEIESAFDGNICRCTGYRAILDAMHQLPTDIEDLVERKCSGVNDSIFIISSDAQWIRPENLGDLFDLLEKGNDYSLVCGNTSKILFENTKNNQLFVDIRSLPELCQTTITEDFVKVGSCVTISELTTIMDKISANQGFEYCNEIRDHLKLIAGSPVRNVGSWAGNLMLRRSWTSFPSDILTLFEAVGAKIEFGSKIETKVCGAWELIEMPEADLDKKVLLNVMFRPLSSGTKFKSYKIMPRSQLSLAYVNAAFCSEFDKETLTFRGRPSLIFGGISEKFLKADKTEAFLANKCVSDTTVLQDAFKMLRSEAVVTADELSIYKKDLTVSLLYRFVLHLVGERAEPKMRSGSENLKRDVSSGTEIYDTHQELWPLTRPLPKASANMQTAGEAIYTNDMPKMFDELFGSFVVTSVGNATIDKIDASDALKMDGVVRFLTYKDIPKGGKNNSQPNSPIPELVFCETESQYAGQAAGLIIAESQSIADEAAKKVIIEYRNRRPVITDIEKAIEKKSFHPKPGKDIIVGNAEEAINNAPKQVKGRVRIGTQYHFTMETQGCICIPQEENLLVYATTQWPDYSQQAISNFVNIDNSRIRVEVKRLGGAYGSKITRNFQIGAAGALAALILNKPIRIRLSLKTNMEMIGKRFPYVADYEMGLDDDGLLLGIKCIYYADCGFLANECTSPGVLDFADNAYFCENWHLVPMAVKTNTPCNTSTRSPSTLPGIFVMEQMMEHAAVELNMDSTILKRLNLYKNGQKTPVGITLNNCLLRDVYSKLLDWCEYDARSVSIREFNANNQWKKKALDVVPMKFGIGWQGANYGCQVTIYNGDGTVSLAHGGIEVGQGINTKAIQVCAYELGIGVDKVNVRATDNFVGSNCQATGGSITSELCCQAVINCCKQLKTRLGPYRQESSSWEETIKAAYNDGVDLTARNWNRPETSPDMFRYESYGATCTETLFDALTGTYQLTRVDILFDCGQSMNPKVDMGQVQGAFVMGLGYFLVEEINYSAETGGNLSASTWEYKVPTSKDIPIDFRVQLLKNVPNPLGVLRSKACGEPPLTMSSSAFFALKKAISEARGNGSYFRTDSPITPERARILSQIDDSDMRI